MKLIDIKKDKIYLMESLKTDSFTNHLIIHSGNDKNMNLFIKILIGLLKKNKYDNLKDIVNIEFSYYKENDNLLEGCDWYDMPEYKINEEFLNVVTITIYYNDLTLINELSEKTNITITEKTKFIWYPERPDKLNKNGDCVYVSPNYELSYPIYIISKGRWEKRYTSKYLESCNIPYKIVIEPQEYNNYAEVIDKSKILILPKKYLNKNMGGIPARNFVLEHSTKEGHKRHWILDDNIMGYYRLNNSVRTPLFGSSAFKVIEEYVNRYTNIKMAGHNYYMFAIPSELKLKPITKNTRIYSSILLSNDTPFKWRGKYNEDTDLSLRLLKKGYSTILFNCVLANKQQTLKQKGGNTDSIYNVKDGIFLKTKSLYDQHPDVVQIIERFGRVHHYVDYKPFKDNNPIFKKGVEQKLTNKINNFGMELIEF
jgi:hypothetical protein